MSRRYGRKQRRAAREQIAAQAAQIDKFPMLEFLYQKKVRAAEAKIEFLLDRIHLWDSEIRSLLGPYTSFAIDEPTYRVDHPDQIRQMPVMQPLSVLPLGPAEIVEQSYAYHIQTMLRFMVDLDERDLERLRRLLTVRVVIGMDYPQGQAYYAISEETWRAMKRAGPNDPGLERHIHRIAGDLVRLLVAPPKKPASAFDLVSAINQVPQG